MQAREDNHWHLDKKVPISIIVALAVQFAGGLWFMAKLEARVLAIESNTVSQRDRDDRQDNAVTAALALARGDIKDMSGKLDRLIERAR